MTLEILPPPLRRAVLALWGATFVGLVFFYLPSQFIEMNAELGWPVWRTGPSRALGGLLIAGGAVWFGIFLFEDHAALLLYAAIATLLVELVVVLWAAPVLERRFGGEYAAYQEEVPRWLPLRFRDV